MKFGQIEYFQMFKDYAYVEFNVANAAAAFLSNPQHEIENRIIRVRAAEQ